MRTEAHSINLIRERIADIQGRGSISKSTITAKLLDRECCTVIDRIRRHRFLCDETKTMLCIEADNMRSSLRGGTWVTYENQLTQTVQDIVGKEVNIGGEIEACKTHGIVDANRMRKLHRLVVRRDPIDNLTSLYLAELISARQYAELKAQHVSKLLDNQTYTL